MGKNFIPYNDQPEPDINGKYKFENYTAWYSEGRYHREDGPAVINHTTECGTWYVRGRIVVSYEQLQRMTGCSDADILIFKLKYGQEIYEGTTCSY